MAKQPKEIDEEKMLRHYLRRQIADINKQISGKSKQLQDGYSNVFKDVVGSFANPKTTIMPRILDDIYDDMTYEHKSSAVYNYFDLDTLYSYWRYLQVVVKGIDKNRRADGRYKYRYDDFNTAMRFGRIWLKDNEGKEESGFYSISNPIKVLTKDRKFAPERTLTTEDFDKRYDERECARKLEEHLNLKHDKLAPDFHYGKEGYYIRKKELYLDINDHPVTYIEASNADAQLYGYFNSAGTEFRGDLFDMEGNFVMGEEDTGVTFYYNKEKIKNTRKNNGGRDF